MLVFSFICSFKSLAIILIANSVEMLVKQLTTSNDTNLYPFKTVFSVTFFTNCCEFLTEYFGVKDFLSIVAKNLDKLYATDFIVDTIGRIGLFSLCTFSWP